MKVLPCDLFGQVILRPRWRYGILYIYKNIHITFLLSTTFRWSQFVQTPIPQNLFLSSVAKGFLKPLVLHYSCSFFSAGLAFSFRCSAFICCSLLSYAHYILGHLHIDFEDSDSPTPRCSHFLSSSDKRGRNVTPPGSQPSGNFNMFYCSKADGCTLSEISIRQKLFFFHPLSENMEKQLRCLCHSVWIRRLFRS